MTFFSNPMHLPLYMHVLIEIVGNKHFFYTLVFFLLHKLRQNFIYIRLAKNSLAHRHPKLLPFWLHVGKTWGHKKIMFGWHGWRAFTCTERFRGTLQVLYNARRCSEENLSFWTTFKWEPDVPWLSDSPSIIEVHDTTMKIL